MRTWLLGLTLTGAAAALVPMPHAAYVVSGFSPTVSAQRAPAVEAPAGRLRLHPDNPRYFLWRGKPTLVITSGEHYGALLNRDFDYRTYLDTLAREGMNGTRTWVGSYVETSGNFDIRSNTLDPAPGRLITPWARSSVPGYADGGNKFDLTKWDEAYFTRFHDFLEHASRRGVIVELVIFCPLYEDSMWRVSPMNPSNHVNGLGAFAREDVLTLDRSRGLLAIQEALARKIVEEAARYDHVYIEVCNEPYATKVPDDWQRHMATVAGEAAARQAPPLLVSQNVANKGQRVDTPHPAISIFNFHYATPPDTVAENAHLNRPIGDNETGFRGTGDLAYRTEAWEFILAGGALYNNLDYSFTVGHEQGTFAFPATQPGGGGRTLRQQLRVLSEFVNAFEFVRMRPDKSVVVGGVPDKGAVQALVRDGQAYAIYLRQGLVQERKDEVTTTRSLRSPASDLQVNVTGGTWLVRWLDPVSGETLSRATVRHQGGVLTLSTPAWRDDVAVSLRRLVAG